MRHSLLAVASALFLGLASCSSEPLTGPTPQQPQPPAKYRLIVETQPDYTAPPNEQGMMFLTTMQELNSGDLREALNNASFIELGRQSTFIVPRGQQLALIIYPHGTEHNFYADSKSPEQSYAVHMIWSQIAGAGSGLRLDPSTTFVFSRFITEYNLVTGNIISQDGDLLLMKSGGPKPSASLAIVAPKGANANSIWVHTIVILGITCDAEGSVHIRSGGLVRERTTVSGITEVSEASTSPIPEGHYTCAAF